MATTSAVSEWVPPVKGLYFDNPTPVTGQTFCEVPRSDEADIGKTLDAAHATASHGRTRDDRFTAERDRLRELLSREEYQRAEASILIAQRTQ